MSRLDQIRDRLQAFRDHEDDPYVYDPHEIPERRDLAWGAPDDLAYLLACVDGLREALRDLLRDPYVHFEGVPDSELTGPELRARRLLREAP